MSESLGQEAFRVFEDVLLEEIASENKSMRENVDGLKKCQRLMDEVKISIGDVTHVYSILEGEIGPDEPVRRCGLSNGVLQINHNFSVEISPYFAVEEGEETNLGTTLKFNLDRFERTVFTLDFFLVESPFALSIEYAGNSFSAKKRFVTKLDLKLNEDDNIIRFYLCQEKTTFQGVINGVGPRDMERGMKGLANQIRAVVEVREFHWSNFFYDSPDMYFALESISIQFTQEINRAYDLTQTLLAPNEYNGLDITSMDSNKKTESDALRSKIAVSLVNGSFVETLCENKQLRSEMTSLSYMKSLLQTCHLKFGNETLIEMKLSRGFLLSDHLHSIGKPELFNSNQKDVFIFDLAEEGLLLDINRLDKFSIILGANQFYTRSGIFAAEGSIRTLFQVQSFGTGYADIDCYFDFGPRQLDDDPELIDNTFNEIFNEGFRHKLELATRPGIDAGFPEWFKLKVRSIGFPIDCVKMLLDI